MHQALTELPVSPLPRTDLSLHENGRPSSTEEASYPEGGLAAWLAVFGSFCALIASFGIMNTIGTFQTYLAQNQLKSYSEGQIGWIFGMYAFVSFFGGIQFGPIFDVAGPRGLVATGTVCLVASIMVLGICKFFWHFMLTFGILAGLGTSLIITPAVASIGHWFMKKRGLATGLATTGGSIGGVIFPLTLQSLIPKIGFAWACKVIGFICLGLLVVGNLCIRSRLEAVKGTRGSGEDGQIENFSVSSPVNDSEGQRVKPLWKFWDRPPLPAVAENQRTYFGDAMIDLSAFRDPRFALTTIGVFLIEWGLFVPLTYITSYAIHLGISSSLSYQLIAILNAGSIFGRWLPGFYADKIGRFNTMILTVLFCLITVLALWMPSEFLPGGTRNTGREGIPEGEEGMRAGGAVALTTMFALLYGFGSGSGISLTAVCVGQICETEDFGKRLGTCYFFVGFGILTGIPIAGQILAVQNGTYTGLMAFTAATYVGALVFFIAARGVGSQSWNLRTIY